MFVTFEGLDGSGKSTQAELLAQHLLDAGRDVVVTREPGGTELGERVRELLLGGEDALAPWAEAALFAAARAELVERVIRPALGRDADVICDRYVDSSLAYQGIARGLGVDAVLDLNLVATGGLLPDLTFLLLAEPADLERRLGESPDRIEREGREFRARVDEAYRELAGRFPGRVVPVDASRPVGEIARAVREALDGARSGAPAALEVGPSREDDRDWIEELLVRRWGATRVVARGRVHDAAALPALVARREGLRLGLATYAPDGEEWELVTLDATEAGRGIGTALVEALRAAASERGCRRVVAVTTNDNTDAMRFYQRRGFRLRGLRVGAVEEARRVKPEIPTTGSSGIPIRDELELALELEEER